MNLTVTFADHPPASWVLPKCGGGDKLVLMIPLFDVDVCGFEADGSRISFDEPLHVPKDACLAWNGKGLVVV
jgi:hypothetical protein